jgi:hypothetical protein
MVMKFCITFLTLLSNLSCLNAQVNFSPVVDDNNPATKTTSPGFYKGAAWVDIDNDGDIDLFVSPNSLFINNGNGNFSVLDDPFQFKPTQPPGGASWADLNNDGYIDCIISQNPSGIYLNNGNSTFRNISGQLPGFDSFASWGCAIGKLNSDVFPDFIFAHARGFHKGKMSPSLLYLNTSQAVSPEKITGLILTDSLKPFTVPYWSDFDQDGDMDLFVASGPGGKPGPDFCYQNVKSAGGKNELKPMTKEFFATQLQDGQCYNFIDFDNDRDLDLCLTNYGGAPSRLYINDNGAYSIRDVTFGNTSNNLANDWGDYDNDGDLDVIITSDNVKTKLFFNNGDGTFSSPVSLGKAGGAGVSNGDYDNDGDLDVYVNGIDSARTLLNSNASTNGNHWINLSLTGTSSGKSALGTIVMANAKIHGKSVWQMREVNAQNSFMSQNDLRVHFGFGDADIIDTLIIKYSNGSAKMFSKVKADVFYEHHESDKNLTSLSK